MQATAVAIRMSACLQGDEKQRKEYGNALQECIGEIYNPYLMPLAAAMYKKWIEVHQLHKLQDIPINRTSVSFCVDINVCFMGSENNLL